MNKNLLLIIIGIAIIIGGAFLLNKAPEGIILFYGDGCPHCENVDNFISQNKIEDKVKFRRLEVFNNKDNAEILLQKAIVCKIDQKNIGVPFLWDGKKCLVGDEDIVKFFQDKINQSNQ